MKLEGQCIKDTTSLPTRALTEDKGSEAFLGSWRLGFQSRSQDDQSPGHHANRGGPIPGQAEPPASIRFLHWTSDLRSRSSRSRDKMKTALPPNPGGARPRPRPSPPPGRLGRWAPSTTQHQGQDDKPEGASTCKVRSQCHLISEQVSLSYEMSLQFALAPLGGGFLKQRDRLGGKGRSRSRPRSVEKQEGGGEKETETQTLNTTSKQSPVQ